MFYEDMVCHEIACKSYRMSGNDAKKSKFLQDNLNDHINATRYKLSKPTSLQEENSYNRLNKRSKSTLEIFKKYGISESSLVLITPIEHNNPRIDVTSEYGKHSIQHIKESLGIPKGTQIDWLENYMKEDTFDIGQLIHDDFFKAINLTFQNKMYVSSMKLLLSCIDSIGYIEYGKNQSFILWLNEYADLEKIGITSNELWELRNSLLHMSNINSYKVEQQKIKRISFFIGKNKESFFSEPDQTYFFNFTDFINIYADALGKWVNSYNIEPDKFLIFIERYDLTISDYRVSYEKNIT